MKYRVTKPSQLKFYEDGTFRRVSDVVRDQGAVAGINLGFYSGTAAHPKGSVPCGQLVLNGQNIRWPADKTPEGTKDAHYHALFVINGRFYVSHWIPESEPGKVVEWGLKMGPRLLLGGEVCLESISDQRWNISRKSCPRVAVGVLPDGRVVTAYETSTTPEKFAQGLKDLGCFEAIGCDGDSSASYVDTETGDSYGYKQMPNALLIMPEPVTEEVSAPAPKQSFMESEQSFRDFRLSPNFTIGEFSCKGTTCGCNHAVSVSPKFGELVGLLQRVRDKAGRPVIVTSGYRCARHDRDVGTSDSPGFGPHTTGTAADIYVLGMSVDELASLAKEAGFTGIGRYYSQGFVHVDMRTPGASWVG